MKKTYLFTLLIALSAILIVSCSSNNATGATTSSTGEFVGIPLEDITSTVQKYDYNANGVKVTYFAVKGSDGKIRTAFDACDVCGGKKGYTQKGNDIECNNCGRVFSIDGLGTKNKGYGCWPSYLSHFIKDGKVMINMKELEQGKHRFV